MDTNAASNGYAEITLSTKSNILPLLIIASVKLNFILYQQKRIKQLS